MKLRFLSFLPFFFLVLGFLSLPGCSVFSSIGDAISDGYGNTVAYFNSYYNAQKLFREAEDEIAANERTVRGRSGYSSEPIPISGSAKQKLSLVIDKCSNILSFHETSALVDDALLMIGKAYFQQGEYLKAERKFAELIAGFPESDVALEGELWLVKTLVRLREDEKALEAAAALYERAVEQDHEDLQAEALFLRGEVFSVQKNYQQAVEAYRGAFERSSDDDVKAVMLFRLAEVWSALGDHARAAENYVQIEEFTGESAMVFASRIRAIRALREHGEYDRSLVLAEETGDDFRFATQAREVGLEKGRTLAAMGLYDDALRELTVVDTTSGKTELGSRAAYEIAKIYESKLGDYKAAATAYNRASAYPVPALVLEVRSRQAALSRYLTLKSQYNANDSLLSSGQVYSPKDSAVISLKESMRDSLEQLRAKNAFELGELFYGELGVPDSAVFWYLRALSTLEDTTKRPRILFVLAELANSNPEKGYGSPEVFYRRIIEKYPSSVYANRSKRQLGLHVEELVADEVQPLYEEAESLIESGNYEQALQALRKIILRHPSSQYAPKSEYTMGWLFEHRLFKPDSALWHYRTLLESYAGTAYAEAVRNRVPGAGTPEDSLRTSGSVPTDERPKEAVESERRRPALEGTQPTAPKRKDPEE